MKPLNVAALGTIIGLSLASGALAQQSDLHHGKTSEPHRGMMSGKSNKHHPTAADGATRAEGSVKAIDPSKRTVTIAHDPIAAKDWPAMTMMFKAPRGLLRTIKPGQRVAFSFLDASDGYLITRIAPR